MVYVVWTGKYVTNFYNVQAKFNNSRIFKEVGAELTKTYKGFEKKLIDDTNTIALKSVKSTVPIHKRQGGTLRNLHIEQTTVEGRSQNYGRIYVDDNPHDPPYNTDNFYLVKRKEGGTYTFRRPPASTLAEILETEDFKRSRNSDPEPGYAIFRKGMPTRGWVELAGYQTDKYIKAYLEQDQDFQSFARGLETQQAEKIARQQQSETVRLDKNARRTPAPPSYFELKTGFRLGATAKPVPGFSEAAKETGLEIYDIKSGLSLTSTPTTYIKKIHESGGRAQIRRILEAEEKKNQATYYRGKRTPYKEPLQEIALRYTGDYASKGSVLPSVGGTGQTLYDYYKQRYGG